MANAGGTESIQVEPTNDEHPLARSWKESTVMRRKRLRVLKRVPPIIGVCEGCLAQFKSVFTGPLAAEAEIRVRFAAHKCTHANRDAPVLKSLVSAGEWPKKPQSLIHPEKTKDRRKLAQSSD
jgi:hypothetical protein